MYSCYRCGQNGFCSLEKIGSISCEICFNYSCLIKEPSNGVHNKRCWRFASHKTDINSTWTNLVPLPSLCLCSFAVTWFQDLVVLRRGNQKFNENCEDFGVFGGSWDFQPLLEIPLNSEVHTALTSVGIQRGFFDTPVPRMRCKHFDTLELLLLPLELECWKYFTFITVFKL